jgi:hypothetical protein
LQGIIIDASRVSIYTAFLTGNSCLFQPMNLNKENIKDSAIVLIAWAIALSLVLLVVEKFKLLLPK